MPIFKFDVHCRADIQVEAASESDAQDKLFAQEILDEEELALGVNGIQVLTVNGFTRADVYEIDGKEVDTCHVCQTRVEENQCGCTREAHRDATQ